MRKDKSLTVVIFVILGVIVACGCGVVALSWAGCGAFKNFMGKVAGPIAGCAINFEAARDAVLDYAKDHGGRLPKAETWQDDVRQYVKKHLAKAEEIPDFINAKTMKPDGEWGCYVNSSRSTGMAFNIELSGKLLAIVPAESAEVALTTLRAHPLGRQAALIGRVTAEQPGIVVGCTTIGGRRVIDLPAGELLPRIC